MIAWRPHVGVGEPLIADWLHHVIHLHAQTVHAYDALVHGTGWVCRQVIRLEVVCVQEGVHVLVLYGPKSVGDQELRAPQTLQIQDAQLAQDKENQ